jgi:hypothetical protein
MSTVKKVEFGRKHLVFILISSPSVARMQTFLEPNGMFALVSRRWFSGFQYSNGEHTGMTRPGSAFRQKIR